MRGSIQPLKDKAANTITLFGVSVTDLTEDNFATRDEAAPTIDSDGGDDAASITVAETRHL